MKQAHKIENRYGHPAQVIELQPVAPCLDGSITQILFEQCGHCVLKIFLKKFNFFILN